MGRGGESSLSRITYVLYHIFWCARCGFEGAKEWSFKLKTSSRRLEMDLLWETVVRMGFLQHWLSCSRRTDKTAQLSCRKCQKTHAHLSWERKGPSLQLAIRRVQRSAGSLLLKTVIRGCSPNKNSPENRVYFLHLLLNVLRDLCRN